MWRKIEERCLTSREPTAPPPGPASCPGRHGWPSPGVASAGRKVRCVSPVIGCAAHRPVQIQGKTWRRAVARRGSRAIGADRYPSHARPAIHRFFCETWLMHMQPSPFITARTGCFILLIACVPWEVLPDSCAGLEMNRVSSLLGYLPSEA